MQSTEGNNDNKKFEDDFTLGRKLGEGHQASVYTCMERSTGQEYACKLIKKGRPPSTAKHSTEIAIMRRVADHPNVVQIKSVYEEPDSVYIVMELCRGGELFTRMQQIGAYAEKEAAKLIRTIVEVVQYLHSLGVMHRDLKPENFVFVDCQVDSVIKAVDFGMSDFFQPGQKFSDVVGSPFYVAPEVLMRRYGPEADVWSVGIILYVLLSGHLPYAPETRREVYKNVMCDDINFSSKSWDHVSEAAVDLVKRMLDKSPVTRITLDEILNHRWIKANGADSSSSGVGAIGG